MGPQRGDYYLTPVEFWKLVIRVFLAGVAMACGVLVTWVAFLAAAFLLMVGVLDISVHDVPTGDRRRRDP